MIDRLPDWAEPVVWLGTGLAAAIVAGLIVHRVFWWTFGSFARRTRTALDDSLAQHLRRPTVLILPIVFVYVLQPLLADRIEPGTWRLVRNVLSVLLPISIGWTLYKLTLVAQDVVLARYSLESEDNLEARAIQTQFRIIRRVAVVAIGVLTLAFVLMTFEDLRRVGTGLLASAGVAGLVLGLAAQRTLSNLLAGLQIALTQPIRLDDVVIVEGEWGRIEEITLTYVVVRIWDLRRLVVPISYFLEKPFQNWTRVSADIMGTVYLHVDYRVPLDAIREELRRIVEASEHWDGKVCGVLMTDAGSQSVTARALVSASDAGKAWSLRCEVREKLVAFVQREYPDSLPRVRAELHGDDASRAVGREEHATGRTPDRG